VSVSLKTNKKDILFHILPSKPYNVNDNKQTDCLYSDSASLQTPYNLQKQVYFALYVSTVFMCPNIQ